MKKKFMDLDAERAMRKELDRLVAQLFSDVDAGRQDEDGAQLELAQFRKHYALTEKDFKPYMDAALQRAQAKRVQGLSSATPTEVEFSNDDWPPKEPDVSNKGK